MILHTYLKHQHERTAQARYRRKERFWAALEDPDTVFCVLGLAFVGGVCLVCLVGFLMPI